MFVGSKSGSSIEHIREFEEIQLKKVKEEKEEKIVEIDAKTGIEKIEDEILESDDELENEESEEIGAEGHEKEKTVHSQEVLKKVYIHLHLKVRPKLMRLITPKTAEASEEVTKRALNMPLAAALINVLISLGPEAIRSFCPNVILKIVDMLRNREFSQRELSRKALLSALESLGDAWFGMFLDELVSGLQSGFPLFGTVIMMALS